MKLIIAGGRTLSVSPQFIQEIIHLLKIRHSEIVSGGAKGIDDCGETFADYIFNPIKRFPADWEKHGKAAGPIRNREMANYSDCLLLIWDGESRGSKNMKEEMLKLNKPVYEVILKKS